MTQSLRARLLIGVISLVVIGLLIADIATYTALQGSLISQLDDQIKSGHNAAISGLGGPNEGSGPASGSGLPAGTVIELVSPGGTVVLAKTLEFPGSTPSTAMPALPQPLPSASEKSPAIGTLAGTAAVSQFRPAIWPADFFSGNYVVLALPMTGLLSPLNRLLQLQRLFRPTLLPATTNLVLLIERVDQARPLDMDPVDVPARSSDAADGARAVAPQRDINLTARGRVVVNGDDTRLRQVVGNLVRNALVHIPPQTPIDISLSTEDSVARLSVADHGPGLAADDIDRIFEPFYRADPSRSRDRGGPGP